MKRRHFIHAMTAAALVWPLGARGAEAAKVQHLGFLGSTSRVEYAGFLDALEDGLRQLGYVDGKNIIIDYRWADGHYELLPELAAELVRLHVDLILTHGIPGARAAKNATDTIPIVGVVVGDLVASGIVASLAHPGGNLTGQTFFVAEVNAKRLELIKEAVPDATRVAVLVNPANAVLSAPLGYLKQTAQALHLTLLEVDVETRDDLPRAFAVIATEDAQALIVPDDALFISNAEYIAELAMKDRLPLISGPYASKSERFISYGADLRDLWFRAATLVDQILKGARPADLPIQQATKFDLIVNLKTAEALGITVPATLLARADEVIE